MAWHETTQEQYRRAMDRFETDMTDGESADGGYTGPKLEDALKDCCLGSIIETVHRPNEIRGFTVLHRRWVVERTFAWMSWCWRLAKDFERILASSLAWAELAACRFMMRRVGWGPKP